jgi:hypothetical protein
VFVSLRLGDKARKLLGEEPAYGGATVSRKNSGFSQKIPVKGDGDVLLHNPRRMATRKSRVARLLRERKR